MTTQFWNHIQPQLEEQVSSILNEASPAYSLLETLDGPTYWWQQEPFKRMKLWHEHADLTLLQWMNTVEALMGEDMADIFTDMLKERLRSAIEYCWAIRMKEMQEELEHEHKEVA